MTDIRERLDGSYRLVRFRRIRNRLFALEAVILMTLATVFMVITGASIKPFYIPMDLLITFMLLMGLIFFVEYLYFKTIEIRASRRSSGKFLMARNAVRDCAAIIGVVALLLSVAILPQYLGFGESGMREAGTGNVSQNANWTLEMMTRDQFGTKEAQTMELRTDGHNATIQFYIDDSPPTIINLDQNHNYRYNLSWSTVNPGFHRIRFEIINQGVPVAIDYEMTYARSPLLYEISPVLGIAIILIAGVGISLMNPLKQKYSSGSIYSTDYVEKLDKGMERMEDRFSLDKTLSEAEIVEETTCPAPAAEPVAAKPATEEEKEKPMARKKGVVDVAGAKTADVPCKSCGGMNSSDSTMCFSCGAVLTPAAAPAAQIQEVVAVDQMERSRRFLDGGRYDDAISCLDSILRSEHENLEALYMKSQALRGLKRYELAIQYLNTIIQLKPERRDAIIARGRTFEEMGLFERAIDNYRKAISMSADPDLTRRIGDIENAMMEDALDQFITIPGIGEAKANALFAAGFKSMSALSNSKVEDLMRAKGVNEKLARKILKHFGKE